MAMKYPAAMPQASSIGGYYSQVNNVGQMQRPQVKRKPAQSYQPSAVQNAIAFMRGRK